MVTFGPTNTLQTVIPPTHTWLRITRTGNVFNGYTSTDGFNWVFRSTATIAMPGCMQVGLFVESINNTTTTQAIFDNVGISGGLQPLAVSPGTQTAETHQDDQAVEKIHEFSLQVYPNPTTGEVNIDLTTYAGRAARIEVWNLFGQVMHYVDIDEVEHDLVNMDLSGYAKGAYLIRVISDGAPAVTKLLNIQ